MTTELEQLKQQRDENFKKLGQYQLQKHYYEQEIKRLTETQEELCNRIIKIERDL